MDHFTFKITLTAWGLWINLQVMSVCHSVVWRDLLLASSMSCYTYFVGFLNTPSELYFVRKVPKAIGKFISLSLLLTTLLSEPWNDVLVHTWELLYLFHCLLLSSFFWAIPSSGSYLFRSGLTFEDEIGFVDSCSRVM
jgi:hypothetical protein